MVLMNTGKKPTQAPKVVTPLIANDCWACWAETSAIR
jgi:hypothetical protein